MNFEPEPENLVQAPKAAKRSMNFVNKLASLSVIATTNIVNSIAQLAYSKCNSKCIDLGLAKTRLR